MTTTADEGERDHHRRRRRRYRYRYRDRPLPRVLELSAVYECDRDLERLREYFRAGECE